MFSVAIFPQQYLANTCYPPRFDNAFESHFMVFKCVVNWILESEGIILLGKIHTTQTISGSQSDHKNLLKYLNQLSCF